MSEQAHIEQSLCAAWGHLWRPNRDSFGLHCARCGCRFDTKAERLRLPDERAA